MKTVFISYANEAMAYSLKRIGRQARRLGIFDEVILYTPKDLPKYVSDNPLMKYARGGGYWIWKPAIIKETLNRFEEGTVVVYVDAGCTLRNSPVWTEWLSLMADKDALCFQYKDQVFPEWEKFGSRYPLMENWTKKSALDYLVEYCKDKDVGKYPQILTGLMFFKGRDNKLLSEWYNTMFAKPELVIDPKPDEAEYDGFARHRHDQSLFTPLAIHTPNVLILPESMEHYSPDTPVWASRIRAATWRDYVSIQVKHYLRIWLGDTFFEKLKHRLQGR